MWGKQKPKKGLTLEKFQWALTGVYLLITLCIPHGGLLLIQ